MERLPFFSDGDRKGITLIVPLGEPRSWQLTYTDIMSKRRAEAIHRVLAGSEEWRIRTDELDFLGCRVLGDIQRTTIENENTHQLVATFRATEVEHVCPFCRCVVKEWNDKVHRDFTRVECPRCSTYQIGRSLVRDLRHTTRDTRRWHELRTQIADALKPTSESGGLIQQLANVRDVEALLNRPTAPECLKPIQQRAGHVAARDDMYTVFGTS